MTYIHPVFHQYVWFFEVNGNQSMIVKFVVTVIRQLKSENVYIWIMRTLHISNLTQSPSYKIWTKLNKILPE
jgi:hypothetical protein